MKYIGRELEVQRMKKSGLLPIFVSLPRQRFLVPCHNMVHCVATWVFPGYDRVWPRRMDFCCDRAGQGKVKLYSDREKNYVAIKLVAMCRERKLSRTPPGLGSCNRCACTVGICSRQRRASTIELASLVSRKKIFYRDRAGSWEEVPMSRLDT